MSERFKQQLVDFVCTGICVAVIATSAIVGTWLLLITMSL